MAHGGPREGAGRKVGSTTKKTRAIADRALAEGLTPLEFMLSVLRDEQADKAQRFEAAKAAAPYVHPRLSNVEAKVDASVEASLTLVELVAPGHASEA